MPTDLETTDVPERCVVALLAAVGVLNLAPTVVAVRPDRARRLYGVEAPGADLTLLLRHRAVLLGLVGAALTASAARPHLRPAAVVAAATSKVAFLALSAGRPVHPALRRVGRADAAALPLLALAAALDRRPSAGRRRPAGWRSRS